MPTARTPTLYIQKWRRSTTSTAFQHLVKARKQAYDSAALRTLHGRSTSHYTPTDLRQATTGSYALPPMIPSSAVSRVQEHRLFLSLGSQGHRRPRLNGDPRHGSMAYSSLYKNTTLRSSTSSPKPGRHEPQPTPTHSAVQAEDHQDPGRGAWPRDHSIFGTSLVRCQAQLLPVALIDASPRLAPKTPPDIKSLHHVAALKSNFIPEFRIQFRSSSPTTAPTMANIEEPIFRTGKFIKHRRRPDPIGPPKHRARLRLPGRTLNDSP